jgi:hypothetical protein
MPIYHATGSKWKGFAWSLLSGLAEPVGGLLGYALLAAGGLADQLVFGVVFAAVGGMVRPRGAPRSRAARVLGERVERDVGASRLPVSPRQPPVVGLARASK